MIDDYRCLIECFDTPTIRVEKGGSKRREYDVHQMNRMLYALMRRGSLVVTLEKSQPMPRAVGGGSISSFMLGAGWAYWRGLCIGAEIAFAAEPAPRSWKAKMLADRGRDKGSARLAAMNLFPAEAQRFERVKDHGRAEAALLAEFGRRLSSPSPSRGGQSHDG